MKIHPDTNSYMQFCFYTQNGPLYLLVPTYFDKNRKEWVGGVQLQRSQKMIIGRGKDSKELENDFNLHLRESLESKDPVEAQETFNLFQPLHYWEEMKAENTDE